MVHSWRDCWTQGGRAAVGRELTPTDQLCEKLRERRVVHTLS